MIFPGIFNFTVGILVWRVPHIGTILNDSSYVAFEPTHRAQTFQIWCISYGHIWNCSEGICQNYTTVPQFSKILTLKSFWTEFFTFFVIFLNLCINTRLARLYIILMAFAFYCVGCAKAFLCLPRPRLPLVKPLESALDWALPSNHAVMATCLPLYVWFYSYLHQAQLGLTSGMLMIKPAQIARRLDLRTSGDSGKRGRLVS